MPLLPDLPRTEIAIVELTNAFRAEHRLGAVGKESHLASAARDYARFLAASPVFSHEADGRHPSDRVAAAGYKACQSAENLAWMLDSRGFATLDLAVKMVEGWKNSPPHRKNLMLPDVSDTGVAVAKFAGEDKYVAVQLFGRPLSKQYQFEIQNRAGAAVGYTIAGKHHELPANGSIRYTVCDAAEIAIDVKPGTAAGKPETLTFKTQKGQVYRLHRSPAGAVAVAIDDVTGAGARR